MTEKLDVSFSNTKDGEYYYSFEESTPRASITFDDILIKPKFSKVASRKDVSLTSKLGNTVLELPVISANMDTVTGTEMAKAMINYGGMGCLHRFWSIDDNVKAFKDVLAVTKRDPWISLGINRSEMERAEALYFAGARTMVVDVAHGAQLSVANFAKALKDKFEDIYLVVGNFATAESVNTFFEYCPTVDAIKVGIGPGSVCSTRIKTGCGVPQLQAILDIDLNTKNTFDIIADGGCRSSGDIAKALGFVDAVMLGGMLAGTSETPGETFTDLNGVKTYKGFRGSASKESYSDQDKTGSWKTDEGVSIKVPYKGSVLDVLQDIEGGLRSAFTYTGSSSLDEFRANLEFLIVSPNVVNENKPHALR